MTYAMSVEHIIQSARDHKADRICFKIGDSFTFSAIDRADITQEISRATSGRIKYQRLDGGRWVDCSRYEFVTDAKSLLRDFSGDALEGAAQCTHDEFISAITLHPNRYRSTLRRILRILHDRTSKNYDRLIVERTLNAIAPFAAAMDDEYSEYFIGYLHAMHEIFVGGLSEVVKSPTPENGAALITRLDELRESGSNKFSGAGQLAALLFRAKVLSLTDREKARSDFEALRKMDQAELVQFFYIDMGSYTYFAADDLTENLEVDRQSIIESIVPLHEQTSKSRIAIALGADQHFFRIYGSTMMFFAQQLPEYDFVFVLCADRDVVEKEESEAREYMASLARFNRSGVPENIHFYWLFAVHGE